MLPEPKKEITPFFRTQMNDIEFKTSAIDGDEEARHNVKI